MGAGGLRLHNWLFKSKNEVDAQFMREVNETTGAVIIGRFIYDTSIDDAWEGANPFSAPVFIVSHGVPDRVVDGFSVVNDGIESVLSKAKALAGDKNVWVMGGANLIQQYIKAGLVDEIQIHIAPVLLGVGTRLFDHLGVEHIELENMRTIQTAEATHLRYRVVK